MSEIFDTTIWPAFSGRLKTAKSIVNYKAAIKEFTEFTGVSFELATTKDVSDYEMYLTRLEQNDKKIKTKVFIYSGEMKYMTLARKYTFIERFFSKLTPVEEIAKVLEDIIRNTTQNVKNNFSVSE